jgi:pimeloyl-ACP methyl ester carboxylesterase
MLGATVAMAAAMPAASATAAEGQKTVVLVHGAFADGSSWAKVIPLLEAKGLKVVAVQNPLSSLAGDIDATKRIIDMQTGPVILVAHSWGGMVITGAGLNDKVAALVYVAAFAPPKDMSVNGLVKGRPPLAWLSSVEPDSAGYLRLSGPAVAKYFAQDLPPDEISVVAATQGPSFAGLFDEKLSAVAHESKPSWYIIAEQDGIIPPDLEASMAKAIGAKTTSLASSHVAMLSHPEQVVEVIMAAADSVK